MPRTVRNLSPLVRKKISDGLKKSYQEKGGVSDATKQKISQSMKQYWSTIPSVSDLEHNNQENKQTNNDSRV